LHMIQRIPRSKHSAPRLYRVTQKKGNFILKTQTKIEEIQEKKFTDRN